jgi:integrase
MRRGSTLRDATLISVHAHADLRPSEALALTWADVRDKTILVQRTVALEDGDERYPSTTEPCASAVRSRATSLNGGLHPASPPARARLPEPQRHDWTRSAYQSWRRRAFGRALEAAGIEEATPYALRHVRQPLTPRRPQRDLRSPPARPRRAAHPHPPRACHRRARGPAERVRGNVDPRGARSL